MEGKITDSSPCPVWTGQYVTDQVVLRGRQIRYEGKKFGQVKQVNRFLGMLRNCWSL